MVAGRTPRILCISSSLCVLAPWREFFLSLASLRALFSDEIAIAQLAFQVSVIDWSHH
jgi:hypothetical protein